MDNETVSSVSGRGNTIPARVRSKHYCFTLNNYTEDEYIVIKDYFVTNNKCKYIIGKEVGEMGTSHLQGYVSFENHVEFNTMKKINGRMHIEIAKGDRLSNIKYCSKENNFETNFPNIKPLEVDPLFADWQFELKDIFLNTKPNKREIYWYWCCCGGSGKTTFVRYMGINHKAILINKGAYKDMINQVYNIKAEIKILMVDIPRCMKSISYAALESIKDGIIVNSKYKTKIINSPHVVVFCNFPPPDDIYSKDRIIEKKLCKCGDIISHP